MFKENLLMRNLNVLERLAQGEATLSELAQSSKCREGNLSSSLQLLQKQGLVSHSGETYQLADNGAVTVILEMITPWFAHFNGQFYEIAKDVARVIHEKSHDANEVVDVMLYGSTLRSESPKDIDLLVIHNSWFLKTFTPYKTLIIDELVGEENARDSAHMVFKQLGYKTKGRGNDSVVAAVGKRISGLGIGDFTDEEIDKRTKEWTRVSRDVYRYQDHPEVSNQIDVYGINKVFDVNVLQVGALTADASDQVKLEGATITGWRGAAIKSCRDPTFWHTILSEGRIYDRDKHDFSIRVEDKYVGALDLFPSK